MTEVRHTLRSELGIRTDLEIALSSKTVMHRSETMRLAFAKAQQLAEQHKSEVLTAFHIVVALFELDLLSMQDCY